MIFALITAFNKLFKKSHRLAVRIRIVSFSIRLLFQLGMGHSNILCRNLDNNLKDLCKTKILSHCKKHASDKNLQGQLHNCLNELGAEKETSYVPFFESVDMKEGTNWKRIFKELI